MCCALAAIIVVGWNGAAPTAASRLEAARARIEALAAGSAADVAVAFRTLDGGDELLIHPDVEYHAASTMKVPVMIELYRQARAGALRLEDEMPIVNEFHSIVDGSPYKLDVSDDSDADVYKRVGGRMSYRALCEAMITVSSNFAANLLIERLGATRIQATTDALGAPGMHVLRGVEDGKAYQAGLNNTTTARDLGMLLAAIANGTAASPASCNEMLAILGRQHFNEGIPAGLPPGTTVYHKTGWIGAVVYHDAALVEPARGGRYVLVVLTGGIPKEADAHALVRDISQLVFDARR